MKKKVVVIGGGIVGLSTAYYLSLEGCEVTVIDQGDMNQGASHVNAGYLTPSHIVPMAAPGMVLKGLRWMFNPSSPFYIQPRWDKDLFKWGIKFIQSCTASHVQRSLKTILEINQMSKALYLEMQQTSGFDFHLETKGLLMAYQTEKAQKEESEVVASAQQLGLQIEHLNSQEVKALQPNIKMDIEGAYWYKSDAHSTPELFMQNLMNVLSTMGVEFLTQFSVTNFNLSGNKIVRLSTKDGKQIKADEFVFATGAWSTKVLKGLGIHLTIQAGKGYRLNITEPTGISLPAILMEAKVAVTPMKDFTRFAGTMEISGINHTLYSHRIQAIASAVTKYYPELSISEIDKHQAQCGLRPLSHDGLPYIGRHGKVSNLVLATGHAMMGWSLGPATGKLVSELIAGKTTSLSLIPFSPER